MRWGFGERFCLETNLRPEFVMGILRDHVGKTHRWPEGGGFAPGPIFEKLTVKGEGRFVLWPSIQLGRNSFRPVWTCELEGDGTGSRLRVRAGSPGTVLFFGLLLGFHGWWGYSAMLGRVPWGWFAGTLGFLLFFLLLGVLGFWIPEREARRGLQRILGGTFL